ncbi:MAG: M1 family aminopeptidase [bacterium]
MKLFNTLILLLVFTNILNAQKVPDYLMPDGQIFDKANYSNNYKPKYNPQLLKEYVELDRRNYDVLRYDLYMDWYDIINNNYHEGALIKFYGVNMIQLVILEDNTEFIELDALNLNIERILINGQASANSNKKTFGILKVDFNQAFNAGDTVSLNIYYNFSTTDNEGGINVYEKGTAIDFGPPPDYDTVFIEEKIVYTMAEPIDARTWIPCNDRPYDKALSTFTVKVPKDYTVTSNGILKNTIAVEDSTTFYWEHKYPLATYLMHAAASKYHYYYDWYKRVTNPEDSIKIEYYVWEKDFQDTSSDGMTYNATYAFRNSVKMMEFYSTIFGEYPYERYGMVAVQDCWFGGMEHQTITTLHRNVLRKITRWGSNGDNGNQMVIAHEMSHQWLGDLITCASWNDIWINEGGAVWSETLWQGRNSEISYDWAVWGKMQTYLDINNENLQPPIYAPSIDNVFNYATTYMKSGSVYHMLGVMFGKENFLQILRDMFSVYGYNSLDTEEFKNFLKTKVENPPVDLDTFFNQWIYKAGHPVYLVTNSTRMFVENEDYEVTVNLAQLQEGEDIPDVFHTLLWLKFHGPDGLVYIDSLVNYEKNETFIFRLPFKPDSMEIDTFKTLCTVASYITYIDEPNLNENLVANVYPNPIIEGYKGYLNLEILNDSFTEIELFDNFCRKISTIHLGYLNKGPHLFNIPTLNLASGIYSIIIKSAGNYISKRFTVIN